jgi:ABC-type amino acid transport substrate-binding protein
MRRFILIACVFTALAQAAPAQITFPSSKETNSIVTILSDGLSEPSSLASQVLSEISLAVDKEGDLRVLSVNGYGGPVNVRDLLLLRNTDLAILNNDVLAYLDLAKALPDARKKVRLIAPLFHQSVFLFARQNVKSIDDLRGRKIGVSASHTSRGLTAKTIFGLLKINAEFVELEDKELAKRIKGDLDAVLVFEKDLPDLKTLGVSPGAYRLLPIPAAGPLAKVYLAKKLGKDTIAGFGPGETLETVQVTTLLTAFDWNAKQGRYPDVVNFVQKFFALLPQMRTRNPGSPFSRTDVKIEVPGWVRFGPSEAMVAAAPAVAPQENVSRPVVSAAQPNPGAEALRLVVVARPPLTDAQKEDGGVTSKLLIDALDAAGMPTSLQWVDGERTLLESLLTSKTGDVGLFWQTPNCDSLHDPSASEASLCDRAVLSEPLMQVVIGVFTRLDTPLDPQGAEAAQVRTLCVPESQSIPSEALAAIPWIKAAAVKTLRPRTLIDCFAAVDRREADAAISIEPEGRFVIERLKLSQTLQISQRPGVTTGLHAVVAKDNPRQAQLIKSINEAIAKFRSSDRYAAIMASHLADLTGMPAKMP